MLGISAAMPRSGVVMLAALALLVVAACSARTYQNPSPHDEVTEGKGLLSGDDGEFVIFKR